MSEQKTAVEIWCRGCRHYDLNGTGECAGVLDDKKAEEKPPCSYTDIGNWFEPNVNTEPNW